MTSASRLPVLVGCAQLTDLATPPEQARSAIELMADAARRAAADSQAGAALLQAVDSLVVLRLFADSMPRFESPFGKVANPPWSLARRLGLAPRDLGYSRSGGDTPQVMVHRACARIAAGESEVALLVGGEALRTELAARRAGMALAWGEDAPEEPHTIDPSGSSFKPHEMAYGLSSPMAMYGLIGQAIRARRGDSVDAYRAACGRLLAPFAAVAHANPHATRRAGYTAEEIATVSGDNPVLGSPYTKRMTANVYVDQAAAIVVCSESKADALGVPHASRIYLHGGAQALEERFVTDRARMDRSMAMRLCAKAALEQAGKPLAAMNFLDLYSCFPAAVQAACTELGLAQDDPRGLTVTGGLPFFGGPGNSYSAFAIVEMMQRTRANPGTFGLVLANAGMLTKQAVGIYSATRPAQGWQPPAASALQSEIDKVPKAPFTETPTGPATIETYVVPHGRNGAESAAVVGRLVATGERFVARTAGDAQTLAAIERGDPHTAHGSVVRAGELNLFTPVAA